MRFWCYTYGATRAAARSCSWALDTIAIVRFVRRNAMYNHVSKGYPITAVCTQQCSHEHYQVLFYSSFNCILLLQFVLFVVIFLFGLFILCFAARYTRYVGTYVSLVLLPRFVCVCF